MINDRKVSLIIPSRNAEEILRLLLPQIPPEVDEVVVVDDASTDETRRTAKKIFKERSLNGKVVLHSRRLGLGAAQKSGFLRVLAKGADIVLVLPAHGRFDPFLLAPMARMLSEGQCDLVLASRFYQAFPRETGMSSLRYFGSRFLTGFQNFFYGSQLCELHSGYYATTAGILLSLPLLANSNSEAFANQLLSQALVRKFSVKEVSCAEKYEAPARSDNPASSLGYAATALSTSLRYFLFRSRLWKPRLFSEKPKFGLLHKLTRSKKANTKMVAQLEGIAGNPSNRQSIIKQRPTPYYRSPLG